MIVTFQEFWKDFDRRAGGFNTSVVVASENKEAVSRCIFFDGAKTGAGLSRIYARYESPIIETKRAVIVMDDITNDTELFDVSPFLRAGISVLVVDYAGERSDGGRFTVYPPAQSFANYYTNPLMTSELPPSNLESCRYVWTTVMLRSIAFLESEGFDKIGLLGVGEGGSQVIKSLALVPELACGTVRYSQTRVTDKDESEYDAALVSYAAALGDKSYCQFIKQPMLFQLTSNEQNSSLDNMHTVFASCAQGEAYISIAPRSSRNLTKEQDYSLLRFYESVFDGVELIKAPKITAKNSEKNLYINISASDNERHVIEKAQLFVAHSQYKSAYRNWRGVTPEKIGEGEYIAKIDVYSENPVYVFFNASYTSGVTLSSNVLTVKPKSLGIVLTQLKPGRLLYSAENGAGEWLDTGSDKAPFVKTGPFDISGVCAESGQLASFAVADVCYAPPSSADLQLIVYSPDVQTVSFSVRTEKGVVYTAEREIDSRDNWLKLMLSPSSFHSADGILPDWNQAVTFEVAADSEFLINTMLWI